MTLNIRSADRGHPQAAEGRSDPFAALPYEVALEVLKYLSWGDLGRSRQVNRGWRALASDPALQRATCPRLGARAWKRLGVEEQEPRLPRYIDSILQSSCPFFEGKRVFQTHRLVLIPQKMTLDLLKTISPIRLYADTVKEELGETPVEGESYWVLMTTGIIPGSRKKSYEAQKALVATHEGYALPKVVEAVACVSLEHAVTGQMLFPKEPLTYTRCQEVVRGKLTVHVGGFGSRGFRVNYCIGDAHNYGVGALRKFC